ncbi:hypothetical protein RSAG8_04367, partial [Rhizoctonia solani AG-8 WAC10335]
MRLDCGAVSPACLFITLRMLPGISTVPRILVPTLAYGGPRRQGTPSHAGCLGYAAAGLPHSASAVSGDSPSIASDPHDRCQARLSLNLNSRFDRHVGSRSIESKKSNGLR